MKLFAAVVLTLTALATITRAGATLYVSPDGVDSQVGSSERPVQTIERALSLADSVKERDVTIELRAGVYTRKTPLVLTASNKNLTVRAAVPGTVSIVSAVRVQASQFLPVTDKSILERLSPEARGSVLALPLEPLGIKHINPSPDVFPGNGGIIELFCGNQRMPVSQLPADGYFTMKEVLDSGLKPTPHGGTFVYRDEQVGSLTNAAEDGLWVVGFWRVPWIRQAVRVESIDPSTSSIKLAAAIPMGIGSKYGPEVDGTRHGDGKEPWYAMNFIEAIRRPGQWCLHFPSKTLYFWPPANWDKSPVEISDSDEPVIHLNGATDIRLMNLRVLGSLREAIRIEGGNDNQIIGCQISDSAGVGITIAGGTNHQVRGCDLFSLGAEAIRATGGDRKSLTLGQHLLSNNHIYNFGLHNKSVYAIEIDGVGNTVSNNQIHDGPLGGIQYRGNDHLIELNEIHHIGLDGGDFGGIYTNGDWASRGNLIRHNFIHSFVNGQGTYLDDGHSGDTVLENVYCNVLSGVFIGGGHDHTVRGNLVVSSKVGIHVDDRGLSRGYTRDTKGALSRFLNTIDYKSDPWASKYPDLVKLMSDPDRLPLPTGLTLQNNAFVECAKDVDLRGKPDSFAGVQAESNVTASLTEAEFNEFAKLGLRPGVNSALLARAPQLGAIPFERIGLRVDADRSALPDESITRRLVPRSPRQIFDSNTDVDQSNKTESRK